MKKWVFSETEDGYSCYKLSVPAGRQYEIVRLAEIPPDVTTGGFSQKGGWQCSCGKRNCEHVAALKRYRK
jgi:hypothetical protein